MANGEHGSQMTGILGGNGSAPGGTYKGVGPGVNLVNIKIGDACPMTYESDLVAGLQWIYNILLVNLSLNSTVAQAYHTSPLDAAVEILWFSGITLVVSAGNSGTPNELSWMSFKSIYLCGSDAAQACYKVILNTVLLP
jgi:serine protease AprX